MSGREVPGGDLTPAQEAELREILEGELTKLERSLGVSQEALRPVELDQTAAGDARSGGVRRLRLKWSHGRRSAVPRHLSPASAICVPASSWPIIAHSPTRPGFSSLPSIACEPTTQGERILPGSL